MKKLDKVCKKYGIALCYIFGSQQKTGKALLMGKKIKLSDPETDLDIAVVFKESPPNTLEIYALLSLEFQELVSPFKADLLFLHEVDHLFQLEAIKGINVYSTDKAFMEAYEEKVMMFSADELINFKQNEQDLFEAIDHGYFEFEYQAD